MTPDALALLLPYPDLLPLWRGAVAHRYVPGMVQRGVAAERAGAVGPWNEEPDRVEWRHLGFPCVMVRAAVLGHWCGYVGTPPGHPWHGRPYDEVDAAVHGGLTFAGGCGGFICHVPEEGEADAVWWLGFDCAHFGDGSPGMLATYASPEPMLGVYRDLAYVRAEVEELAEQAAAAAERSA